MCDVLIQYDGCADLNSAVLFMISQTEATLLCLYKLVDHRSLNVPKLKAKFGYSVSILGPSWYVLE
jgi:hypothetical protein